MDFRYPDKPRDSTPNAINFLCQDDWISQAKYDGWRIQIYIDKDIKLFSRVGTPFERLKGAKLPSNIKESIKSLGYPNGTVLDGEFVGPRGSHDPNIYLFDCLAYDGTWLTEWAYRERFNFIVNNLNQIKDAKHLQIATTAYHENENIATLSTDIKLNCLQGLLNNDYTVNPHISFFNILKNMWNIENKTKDFLYEGIVVKRLAGKLTLSLRDSVKSLHMQKLKFRDIGDKRY